MENKSLTCFPKLSVQNMLTSAKIEEIVPKSNTLGYIKTAPREIREAAYLLTFL